MMDVLVISGDKPRPQKLFSRPEGLQTLSLIDPFFDPFPNPFRVLVPSGYSFVFGLSRCSVPLQYNTSYSHLPLPTALFSLIQVT